MPHDLKVGDVVEYLPHVCHAQNRCRVTGDFPWVMGLKRVRINDSTTPPTKEQYVEELSDNDLAKYFGWLKRTHPDMAEKEKKNLVFIRPKAPWSAKVVAVNADGTVDLAIASNQGGVTLNYQNIQVVDVESTTHHTCRKCKR